MVAEMTDERLAWHMANWERWMASGDSHHLGYPSHSVGFINGVSVSEDSDVCAEQEQDDKYARDIDAIIGSLPDPHKMAIMISRKQCARAFNYFRISYEDALDEAHETIRKIAARRNVL
jgi:hypothetical protein